MHIKYWMIVGSILALVAAGSWRLAHRNGPSSKEIVPMSSQLGLAATAPPASVEQKKPKRGLIDSARHPGSSLSTLNAAPNYVALNFPAFVTRAEDGDLNAIRSLADAVRGCDSVPRDPAKLEATLAILEKGLEAASGGEALIPTVRAGQLQAYERCGLFSVEQAGTEKHWLRQAVINGADDLIGEYYFKNVGNTPHDMLGMADRKQFGDEAMDLLRSAADRGAPQAYQALSDVYERGRLGVDNDPVKAYAYCQAYLMAIADESGAPIEGARNTLERLGLQLNEQQLEEAKELYLQQRGQRTKGTGVVN